MEKKMENEVLECPECGKEMEYSENMECWVCSCGCEEYED
jgi:hypothetical protein